MYERITSNIEPFKHFKVEIYRSSVLILYQNCREILCALQSPMHDKITLVIRNIELITGKHDVSKFLLYLFLENSLIPNKLTKCNDKK